MLDGASGKYYIDLDTSTKGSYVFEVVATANSAPIKTSIRVNVTVTCPHSFYDTVASNSTLSSTMEFEFNSTAKVFFEPLCQPYLCCKNVDYNTSEPLVS